MAGLADWLSVDRSAESSDPFAVVLPIRLGGTKPPIWCVHGALGLAWGFRGLVSHLDEHPIYGLQARGLDDATPFAASIPAMVDDYLQQVLAIQAEGPFFLLGFSFGGIVAHAMAAELHRRGHDVALLGLLDSDPASPEEATLALPDDHDEVNAMGVSALTDHGLLADDADRKLLVETTVAIMKNNMDVLRNFESPCYQGSAVLFLATDRDISSPEEAIAPWQGYIEGPISAYTIACTHDEMIAPNAMADIGRILNELLTIEAAVCI